MIRIPTLLGLGVLLAGLVAGVFVVQRAQRIDPKASESAPAPENITISNITDQSFTVSWTTASAAIGFLQIGNSAHTVDQRVLDDRDKSVTTPGSYVTHYITALSLKQGMTYYFRIGEGINSFFDQNGTPFSVTTATLLAVNPTSDSAQGMVKTASGQHAGGAMVYAQLPGGQLLSTLVSVNGNWIIPLSTARTSDLTAWLPYDQSTTVYALRFEGGSDGRSDVTLSTSQDRPTPPIILGKSYDLRQSSVPALESSPKEESSLFEFPSLGPVTPSSVGVTLENPKDNGEVINTDKPEFFGNGPAGTDVTVIVNSPQKISTNVKIAPDGTWSYAPPSSLPPGQHDITLQWTDPNGVLQTLTRSFVVSASDGGPAFTSTPSATPTTGKTTPTPAVKISPSPTPTVPARTSVPSGTPPQSGNLTPSLLLFMIGSVLIVGGVALVRQEAA